MYAYLLVDLFLIVIRLCFFELSKHTLNKGETIVEIFVCSIHKLFQTIVKLLLRSSAYSTVKARGIKCLGEVDIVNL